jgi:GDP-L-fucose synthase
MSTEAVFPLAGKRLWVAGHNGMVGAAIVRRLARENCEVLTLDRKTTDLRDQAAVRLWLEIHEPDAIFLAAAKVGGILANSTYPADFLYDNLAIETNVIEAACRAGVSKLLFLGSSCIYPKMAPQPITEDALLTGPLEPTNEWYAIAKIAGIKLCQAYRAQHGCDFISAMPTNLYGPGDNFDLDGGHVVPALLRKFHEAAMRGDKAVTIFGSGAPRREFLHVDDCAAACVHLMKTYSGHSPVNIGSGEEITIRALAAMIAGMTGFRGSIVNDLSRPDGTPRKLLDSSRLRATGWSPEISFADGLAAVYAWFREHEALSHAPA